MVKILVRTDVCRNVKVLRLARDLGIDLHQAVEHLVHLWCAIVDAQIWDGALRNWTPQEVALYSGWGRKNPDLFADSLVKTGLLARDENGQGYVVNDWDEEQGPLIRERQRYREMRRRQRAQKRSDPAPRAGVPPGFSPTDEICRLLLQKAKILKLRNKDDWVYKWIESHVAAGRAKKLDEILSQSSIMGLSTIEIDRLYFENKNART